MLIAKFQSEGKFNAFLEEMGLEPMNGYVGEVTRDFEDEDGHVYYIRGFIFGKGICHIAVSEEKAVSFKAELKGTTKYYKKAIKEWCKANRVTETDILVDVDAMTDVDRDIVVDVFNNEKTVATLNSVVLALPLLKEKIANGVKNLYLIASPYDHEHVTVGYKL